MRLVLAVALLVLTACETGFSDCSKVCAQLVPCIGDTDGPTCTSTCCSGNGAVCPLCGGFCHNAGTAPEYLTASCVDACNGLSGMSQTQVLACAGASTCTALLACQ